jgi:predicted RNase H-like nuclease
VFIGVDGHSKGWVAIGIDDRGFMGARSFADFAALMAANVSAKVIAIDIPIGLVDMPIREADQAARGILAGKTSSVFNAPPRRALAAVTYEQANVITLEVCKKGLSRQSYALFPKILEVDAFEGDKRVFEVHPEVSFRLMHPALPLQRKKSWGGLNARLARLAAHGIVLPASLGEADVVGIDDVVDAAVAAWSARRIHTGVARSFPLQPTQRSASERAIAIWG